MKIRRSRSRTTWTVLCGLALAACDGDLTRQGVGTDGGASTNTAAEDGAAAPTPTPGTGADTLAPAVPETDAGAGAEVGSVEPPPPPPGAPALLYTDLLSAPAGAFVTIWGKRLGATQGSSKVMVGSAEAVEVLSWSDTTIELVVPTNASSAGIHVQARGSKSNLLPFSVRAASVYYVDIKSGSDANDGKSPATAWRNIYAPKGRIQPGDIVYVRAGDYTDIEGKKAILVLGGTLSSEASKPTAFVAYPGEQPLLKAPLGSSGRAIRILESTSYITVAKLKLVGGQCVLFHKPTTGIRLVGNECSDGGDDYAAFGGGGASELKMLGNYLHDNGDKGDKLDHHIYISGGADNAENVEIAWNTIVAQRGGRGIQVYNSSGSGFLSGLSIHDNFISGTPYNCITIGNGENGADPNWLSDARIYNNVLTDCGTSSSQAALRMHSDATFSVFNNTISSATSQHQVDLTNTTNVTLQNNILDGSSYFTSATQGIAAKTNCYVGSGAVPSWDTASVSGDAKFVSASSGDFHLEPTSACVDKGSTVAEVRVDRDGTPRPQGAGYDMGAYEALYLDAASSND